MTRPISSTPCTIDFQAEGAPNQDDVLETPNPTKTSSVPLVSEEELMQRISASETGLLAAVILPGEGRDGEADGQDATRTSAEATAEPKEIPAAKPTTKPVVLIVEDTMELAEVIQATLERMNMVTYHETHGLRAISTMQERKPDVVLLDISLPDMTGWKILDTIKEKHERENTHMPIVIVITAYGDPANRLVGKLHAVFSYLVKPFTADEVEKVVTQALGSTAR